MHEFSKKNKRQKVFENAFSQPLHNHTKSLLNIKESYWMKRKGLKFSQMLRTEKKLFWFLRSCLSFASLFHLFLLDVRKCVVVSSHLDEWSVVLTRWGADKPRTSPPDRRCNDTPTLTRLFLIFFLQILR